ncbi:MAG TPA: oligosaccharide flippase family protein [Ideonella sp.]|nr:oligosaccharide flippase family protein [Ideonella sp.]
MPSKPRTSLATHYLRYALGNVLMIGAGFVSFPITTRLLSNEQFGVLSYWEAGLLLLVAVVKLGGGDAIVRFYPHGGDGSALSRYATNFIVLPALVSLGVWLLAVAAGGLAASAGWLDAPTIALVAIAQALPLVWGGFVLRAMQAREQSGLNTVVSVLWRWLIVAATLTMLLLVQASATSVLIGRLLAHLLVAGVLLVWLLRNIEWWWRDRDLKYAREGMSYGAPLAMMEVSNILLAYIDRVMLKWLVGDFASVGIYSIGYALASYVDQLISTALNQALGPVVNRVYAQDGAAGVRALKARVLTPLVYLCAGLGAGVLMVGRDFLAWLASADKAGSAPVFMLLGVAFLVRPILYTAGEGLLLEKRSGTVFAVTAGAAVANVLLNLVLIPRFGFMGAAYACCVCVLGRQYLLYRFCPADLRVLPSGRVVAIALGLALACLGVASATDLFGLQGPFARLLAATGLLLAGYAVPVLLLDGDIRRTLLRLRSGAAQGAS